MCMSHDVSNTNYEHYTLCISKAQAEAYMFNNKQVKL